MTRRIRITVFVLTAGLILLIGAVVGLYVASQHVPPFYAEALAVHPQLQQQASHEMVRQTAALASESRKIGRWQALFTVDQINGWLAVDLVQNHPELLPQEVSDPRVAIESGWLKLGCRFDGPQVKSVLSLEVSAALSQPNVIALHLRHARAGKVPLPLSDVLKVISQSADELGLRIEQREVDGEPVILVSIPPTYDDHDNRLQLETLELRDGAIFIAGHTQKAGEALPGRDVVQRPVVNQAAIQLIRQR